MTTAVHHGTARVALVTGANQGIGEHVAAQLVADGATVYVGSRDLDRGRVAAARMGGGARVLQLDVTDAGSVAAAVETIEAEAGRLDLLVNNAGAAWSGEAPADLAAFRARAVPSRADLEEVRAVWEVNAFGVLAVYQAALPLLRAAAETGGARVVNVTSTLGSLGLATDPRSPTRALFEPVYAASKTALNALTLAMMVELEGTGVHVHLVSPGFARTALVGFEGTESVADAAREVLRVARLGPAVPGDTFTTWEDVAVPW
jgi:NAD(P)-dependent dehydrogenase (short-subunit alcohol dehydrogenase family)